MKAKVIVIATLLTLITSCASSRTTNCDAYGNNTIIHNMETDVIINTYGSIGFQVSSV